MTLPSTEVETAIAQCTSRIARGHRLNTSIVLAAVHGLAGLFRAVSAVELSLIIILILFFFSASRFAANQCQCLCPLVLGGSGGAVNSLDFCPASLKSLGCVYFRYVLSSCGAGRR